MGPDDERGKVLDTFQCGWTLEGLAIALLNPDAGSALMEKLFDRLEVLTGVLRVDLERALAERTAVRVFAITTLDAREYFS